ncbi:MAG TPA: nucleotidyl transferase AbiEii/AbiGii toxin family protein [Polyangiaceae bacterium]|jgi:hypothetical protein
MRSTFERNVVPEPALRFLRACQAVVPCHLGGGAALSGAWLAHRRSRDLDLFVHDRSLHRDLVAALGSIAQSVGAEVRALRGDAGHVRAQLLAGGHALDLDVVHEALADLEQPIRIESILVESPSDLRAAKLTCILSRSEPRDLVDLLFLERAGYPPEKDLPLALRKDAGIDPGILAWLLRQFPVEPLPEMLVSFSVGELLAYRDDLALRMKRLAVSA